jgi:predicted choloylglycine hydrolase
MYKSFHAVAEDRPGPIWRQQFHAAWPAVRAWYLREGLAGRPTPAEGRAALERHMPEMVAIYDQLCRLAGDDEIAHRALSGVNPPRVIPGCSQAAWLGAGGPALLRNYDFDLDFTTGIIERTRWAGRRVIAMREAFWGCLDGMNEDGLSLSLTFGGSRAHGPGIAMPMVLRYVLETCRTTEAAVAKLLSIPVPMAQNVTVLDSRGKVATVFTGPDRAPAATDRMFCTNHQEAIVWPEMAAASRTLEREAHLGREIAAHGMTLERLAGSLLAPPLYQLVEDHRFATVYSALYRPAEGRVDYFWPGHPWRQSFEGFSEGSYTHRYLPVEATPAAAGIWAGI